MEMAKKLQDDTKKRRKKWPFMVLIVIVVAVATTTYLYKDKIAPLVVDIPVLNTLFPLTEEDPYLALQKEDVIEQLKQKEAALANLEATLQERAYTIQELQYKVQTLEQYEKEYVAFLEKKQLWDEEVAQSDPDFFMEQFEAMYPEVAAKLYQEMLVEAARTKAQQKQSATIAEMDSGQAARALETLVQTDTELVRILMLEMATDRQADILSEMTTQYAAQVIKLISPRN